MTFLGFIMLSKKKKEDNNKTIEFDASKDCDHYINNYKPITEE